MQETLQNHNALLNDLPEPLGAVLTRARLSKKLEIREAASRIGIDASVIQALEDDDFQQLGAPVFVRNFLLRYSRLLELPEQNILERFRQMGLDSPPPLKVERPIQRQARMTDMRWLAYPVVVVGVLWLSYVGFERLNVHYSSDTAQTLQGSVEDPNERLLASGSYSGQAVIANDAQISTSSSANPMTPAIAASVDPTAPEQLESSSMVDTAGNDEIPQDDAPIASDTLDESEEQQVEALPQNLSDNALDILLGTDDSGANNAQDDATPLVAVANLSGDIDGGDINDTLEADINDDLLPEDLESSDELASVPDNLPDGHFQLELTFSEDCWVEVRDANGERLVRAILNANTVNSYVGQAPFSLTLGNAAAVTGITLNGESVDSTVYIPSRGNVSRFTLEAPQG